MKYYKYLYKKINNKKRIAFSKAFQVLMHYNDYIYLNSL